MEYSFPTIPGKEDNILNEKKTSYLYKVIKWLEKTFYPKIGIEGEENIPEEAVIIVGNHSQMNGPIAGELYTPGKAAIFVESAAC